MVHTGRQVEDDCIHVGPFEVSISDLSKDAL